MKKQLFGAVVLILAILCVAFLARSYGADQESAVTKAPAAYEYSTIRWGGRDNTHIIRPGGEVEFVGNQLKQFKKPDRADDRSFYMNIVLNGMAREGWELVAMTADDMVLCRNPKR